MKLFGSIIHEEKPKSEKSITRGFNEHVSESAMDVELVQLDKRRLESLVHGLSSEDRRNLS